MSDQSSNNKEEEEVAQIPPTPEAFFDFIDQLAAIKDSNKPPLPPLTSCAIQGGGAKGAAYAGTFEAMEGLGVTKTTTEYCGASAGAITDFLIGLGYDAEQFKAVSESMNFLDLNDYNESMFGRKAGGTAIGMLTSLFSQGYVHSGESFHEWARAQCAMVYGNPDITFAEMAAWCKAQTPPVPVPDIKFMGTALDKGSSVCFSYDQTPDVVIADAVRASMSFPGAFQPFKVREKNADGKFYKGDYAGNYADGGILNNYPIDQLSTQPSEDRVSPYRFPKVKDIEGNKTTFNPGAYGLSLTTKLRETDERVMGTPESLRLTRLKGDKQDDHTSRLAKAAERRDEGLKEKQLAARRGSFRKIARVIRKNVVGGSPTSKKDNRKKKNYKDKTILIYTEGVSTLEFQVSDKKKKLIEDSGRMAFINWFIEHRDPRQNYEDFFKAHNVGGPVSPKQIYDSEKFNPQTVLEDEDAIKLGAKQKREDLPPILTKYLETLIDFDEEKDNVKQIWSYLNKNKDQLTDKQKIELEKKFSDPRQNQKLKHLAWQLKKFETDPTLNAALTAFKLDKNAILKIIIERKERLHKQKIEKKAKLNANIGKESLITKINTLLAENTPEKTGLALAIFRGQLSNMFDLMREDPTLLSRLAEKADAKQLESLIKSLEITASQLEQQNRVFHKNYGMLSKLERERFENFGKRFSLYLTTVTSPPLLEQAITQKNPEKIKLLLKSPYFNPLSPNTEGRTTLHACVDAGDADTFEKIIADFYPMKLAYDINGNSILHYAFLKGDLNFLNVLLRKPKTKAWLRAMHKNDPEHRAGFGLGVTLKDHILDKASDNLILDLEEVNNSFYYNPPLTRKSHKDAEKSRVKLENEMTKMQYMANENSCSFSVFQIYLKGIKDIDENMALALLTTPFSPPASATLLKYAATDNTKEKRYSTLALAIIKRCEKNTHNHEKIKTLFQNKFQGDRNLLFLAIEHNNLEFIDVCLKYKANINNAGPHECVSAMTRAAELGHLTAVEKIATSGLEYSRALPDRQGKNALHYLAQNPAASDELIVKLLVKSKLAIPSRTKKIDVPDVEGKTVFDYLIASNRLGVIKEISNQNRSGGWKLNDYFEGLFTHHLPGRKTSLEYLADLEKDNSEKYRPILVHVLKNISKSSRMKQDSIGKTPLHYMASCSAEEIDAKTFVQFLESKNTTLHTSAKYHLRTNIEDNEGNSVLRALIKNNRADIIEYLHKTWTGWQLNAIFDLHTVRSDGKTDMQFIHALQKNTNLKNVALNSTLDAITLFLPPALRIGDNNGNPIIHNLLSSTDSAVSASTIWENIHQARTVSSPTGIREKQADYSEITSLRDGEGKTLFQKIIDSNRADVLAEFAKHCNMRWRLDHYFDLNLRSTHSSHHLYPDIPENQSTSKIITDLEYALSPKIGTPALKAILIKNLSAKTLLNNQNDSNRRTVLHHIAIDKKIDPRLFWSVLQKNHHYKANSDILDVNGNTAFRLLVDGNRTDIMSEMVNHCGHYASGIWKLNHYFDFNTTRPQDEHNDLVYLILKAKKEPAKYFRLLKLVKTHTSEKMFNEALHSIEHEVPKKIAHTASLFKNDLEVTISDKKLSPTEAKNAQTAVRHVLDVLENLIENPAYMNKNSPAFRQFVKLMIPLKEATRSIVMNFMEEAVLKLDKDYDISETFKGLTPGHTFLSLAANQFRKSYGAVEASTNRSFLSFKQQAEKELKHTAAEKTAAEKTAAMPILRTTHSKRNP